MAYREHTITLTLCEGDFEMSMGRLPCDDEEFEEWAYLCEKGLLNGHIDWDILYDCTREALAAGPHRSIRGSDVSQRQVRRSAGVHGLSHVPKGRAAPMEGRL